LLFLWEAFMWNSTKNPFELHQESFKLFTILLCIDLQYIQMSVGQLLNFDLVINLIIKPIINNLPIVGSWFIFWIIN
jgi:hypothetical protein